MVFSIFLALLLAILGGLLIWLGTISYIATGLVWFTIAMGYYNTFMDVVPFLRLPFNLFVSGVLLELILLVIKLFFGSRSPVRNNN